jgi:hypothetical protein
MPTDQELIHAAERLHAHVLKHHYSRGLVHGPDAGVRFQLRLWRFFKSALDFVPWSDDYVFMQSQGYWILSNWMLHKATSVSRRRPGKHGSDSPIAAAPRFLALPAA